MMHILNDEMCIQDIPETNKHPLLRYHHNNDSFYMYSVPISLGKVEKKMNYSMSISLDNPGRNL